MHKVKKKQYARVAGKSADRETAHERENTAALHPLSLFWATTRRAQWYITSKRAQAIGNLHSGLICALTGLKRHRLSPSDQRPVTCACVYLKASACSALQNTCLATWTSQLTRTGCLCRSLTERHSWRLAGKNALYAGGSRYEVDSSATKAFWENIIISMYEFVHRQAGLASRYAPAPRPPCLPGSSHRRDRRCVYIPHSRMVWPNSCPATDATTHHPTPRDVVAEAVGAE